MDANLDADAKGAEAHGSSKVSANLSDFFWCHIPPTYPLAMFQMFHTFALLYNLPCSFYPSANNWDRNNLDPEKPGP